MSYPKLFLRLQAFLLDSVIISVVLIFIILISSEIDFGHYISKLIFILAPTLSLEPFLTHFTGGSIGHHYAGLKVINTNQKNNLSLFRSYVRFFVKLPIGIYSFISILITKKHQAIHDLFSGSVVIFKNEESVPGHYKLKERETTHTDQKPSKARRFIVSSAHCFLLLVIFGVGLNIIVSHECIENDVCTGMEENLLMWGSLLMLAGCLGIYIAGFLCKLPGAIYKGNKDA